MSKRLWRRPTSTWPSLWRRHSRDGGVMSEITDEELLERADDTTSAKGLRPWLRRNQEREEYKELFEVVNSREAFVGIRFVGFEFEPWMEELERIERTDLVESLLYAVNEWRADAAGRAGARTALSVADSIASVTRKAGVIAEMPLPVLECGFKDPVAGSHCTDAAMPGAMRCRKHGGDWIDPRVRQSLLMAAYMRLVEASEVAVDTLIWVAVNGKREEARVMAAREILDRSGIRAGVDINVTIPESTSKRSTADQLMERLGAMADSLAAREAAEAASILDVEEVIDDPGIVDAEVVENGGS